MNCMRMRTFAGNLNYSVYLLAYCQVSYCHIEQGGGFLLFVLILVRNTKTDLNIKHYLGYPKSV